MSSRPINKSLKYDSISYKLQLKSYIEDKILLDNTQIHDLVVSFEVYLYLGERIKRATLYVEVDKFYLPIKHLHDVKGNIVKFFPYPFYLPRDNNYYRDRT